ncbi:MAG TPA: hypothetical protein VNO51_17500 [Ilumatobacteraceae bacterium]|nr:hypothetical protein [Ilumatobacteraceae bacterium]
MKERTLWSSGIGLVLIGVAVAVLAIAMVRFTGVPAAPWGYVGLVVGALSAIAGAGLAFIRAKEWSD